MATDNSMASKMEDWIITQLAALDAFDADLVQPLEGFLTGQKLVDELVGHATPSRPYAGVQFEGDRAIPLQEGEQAYDPVYAIYVVVKNDRLGAARRGDGTSIGTNGLRDVIRAALHGKYPNIGVLGFYASYAEFRGVEVAQQERGVFIMRAELLVRATPIPEE